MAMTYIVRRQKTVEQWVALRPLFEGREREKENEGGELRREAWWSQEATEKQLQATLSGISRDAKRRSSKGENVTQEEPEGRAGWEVRILGWRQETPRWKNELVW